MGCRPRAPSVLHCHGVLALRDRSLSEALLAVLEGVRLVLGSTESDVWHYGSESVRSLAMMGFGRCETRSVLTAMVFWPCELVFERSFAGNAGRCETSF